MGQLPSWNDGAARAAILDYLALIGDEAGEGYVPPAERVAVFDNDGTLWCEQPFGTAFGQLVYAPMLELLELLRAHRFRVFIVTGGGVDFVRVVAAELYGVQRDDVVGSAVKVTVEERDARLVLVRSAELDGPPNEGAPKVAAIHQHLGARPIFAAGNSAGDTEMLRYAAGSERPSLCIVVDHDDAEREYAYAGAALTNPAAEAIEVTAAREGWTIVSMQRDWSRIFP